MNKILLSVTTTIAVVSDTVAIMRPTSIFQPFWQAYPF